MSNLANRHVCTISICKYCKSEMTGRKRRFCNARCRDSERSNRVMAKKGGRTRFYVYIDCATCGKNFRRGRHQCGDKFCSLACNFAAKKANRKVYKCHECGKQTDKTHKYCSAACKLAPVERRRRDMISRPQKPPIIKEPRERTCRTCGITYLFHKRPESAFYCSRECKKYGHRESIRKSKRRRRARKFGCNREPYKTLDIFIRDKWTCWICGKACDTMKAVPHSDAPTIDHVIPYALGGADAPDNVACACFWCNVHKSDSVLTLW